jgi:hypothetical protein
MGCRKLTHNNNTEIPQRLANTITVKILDMSRGANYDQYALLTVGDYNAAMRSQAMHGAFRKNFNSPYLNLGDIALPTTANTWTQQTYTMPDDGYLYLQLYNKTAAGTVWFDDLTINLVYLH